MVLQGWGGWGGVGGGSESPHMHPNVLYNMLNCLIFDEISHP